MGGETRVSQQEQAKLLFEQGKIVRAAVIYKKLIKTEPSADNFNALGEIYLQQGLFDDACAMFARALKLAAKLEPKVWVN